MSQSLSEIEGADTIPAPPPFKKCPCGQEYTKEEWGCLLFKGFMQLAPEEPDLELRNCLMCNSTLAIEK